MSKIKIYDIRPPEKQGPPSIRQKPTPYFNLRRPFKGLEVPKFSLRRCVLLAGVVFFIAVFLFLHFSAKAEIRVFPSIRLVSESREATARIEEDELGIEEHTLPARIITAETEISQNFSATGSAETATKAGGIIKVINNYNLQQILVAKTRFLSADSKLFYSQERVVIPPGGSRTVSVMAAEPGPDYNIDKATFSIPGLLGSPRYTSVYAESESPMVGGSRGEVAQITKNDLAGAEERLTDSARKRAFEALEQEAGTAWALLEGAEKIEVMDTSSSVQEGGAADVFKFTVKTKGVGLVFERNGLKDLVDYWALEVLSQGEKIRQDSQKIEAVAEKVDFDAGKLDLTIIFSFEALKDINGQMLKSALLGKGLSEGRAYFSNYPDIERAEIRISPFWVRSIPNHPDKLKIHILEE